MNKHLLWALGAVLLAGVAWAASGVLDLSAPWGAADRVDRAGVPGIELTYAVKAGKSVPQAAINAVHDAIAEWNDAIDVYENGWFFDIVPFGASSAGSSGGSPSFTHKDGAPHGPGNGHGPGGGGGRGEEPDITIQIKKGGGTIAGSAQRTLDGVFVVKVKIQISGGSFGLQNDPATIKEITMHEVGHGLGLGHHSNEQDLMGRTVGYEGGGPSLCDMMGFLRVHAWLTEDLGAHGAYRVPDTSISCP